MSRCRTGCASGCRCARCLPRCPTGPTGPTGATGGPTGPTGPEAGASAQIGLRTIPLAGEPLFAVTPAMLDNPSHPGARYLALSFVIGDPDVVPNITLPTPATNDDAYELTIENRTANDIILNNDALAPANFLLHAFRSTEISLEDEIQDAAATSTTYRTKVLVTTSGVYRVPGFTSA